MKRLWALRMDNPLADAETFKIRDGRVVELGKKPTGYNEIQAQYMGLILIRSHRVKAFVDFYHTLDRTVIYDGKD